MAAFAGTALAVASAGTALAISGGNYAPAKQGCGKHADANNRADQKQPKGCHDTQVLLGDGAGHTFLEAGTNTTRAGDNLHSGSVVISPDGSANAKGGATGTALRLRFNTHYQPIPPGQCGLFDLATYPLGLLTGSGCTLNPAEWRLPTKAPKLAPHVTLGKRVAVAPDLTKASVYFGADDGLDTGEHDEPNGKHGTTKEEFGPSDGGAIGVDWHPLAVSSWLTRVISGIQHGSLSAFARDPVPFLSAGAGACADAICFSGQSRRTEVLAAGGKHGKHRDVYNYDGKTWDPYNCSGQSPQAEKQCHDKTHKNEDSYFEDEARHVDAEPGFQFYEDPDPSGSPLAPWHPLPAVYAGTCGVVLGGGPIHAPASPITNHSGQLVVSPTHC